jgi:UDP-glucose 4-epimerase
MKILVSGGAGFIGSHLVDRLVKSNHHVTVLDNLSTGNRSWVNDNANFVFSGLNDLELLYNITKDCDVVFHLAAMSRSGPSINQSRLCLESNVVGTHNLLEACKLNKVKKFIYSASSTCYGNISAPHKVEGGIDILNFYGLSKYYGEQESLLFGNTSDLEVISLRYFNVYGPRQPVEGNYALAIGIFVEAKLQNRQVTIHGDGKQTRDFVHVEDVVNANILASKTSLKNKIYNIGTGKSVSILDIANFLNLEYNFGPKREGDAKSTLADISNTIKDLKWEPKVGIYQGLESLLTRTR